MTLPPWPPNFAEWEFNRRGRSSIAPEHQANVRAMAWVLQILRGTLFDNRPMTITNGYRTPLDFYRLRKQGHDPAANSWHNAGLAADFVVKGLPAAQVQQRLRDHGWKGGLGTGRNFTHIDLRPGFEQFGY